MAWPFEMRDCNGSRIGWHMRYPGKVMHNEGRRGIGYTTVKLWSTPSQPLIVVEGPFDVIDNRAACVFGAISLSSLRHFRLQWVWLWPDPDMLDTPEKRRRFSRRVVAPALDEMVFVQGVILSNGDPDEATVKNHLTLEEVLTWERDRLRGAGGRRQEHGRAVQADGGPGPVRDTAGHHAREMTPAMGAWSSSQQDYQAIAAATMLDVDVVCDRFLLSRWVYQGLQLNGELPEGWRGRMEHSFATLRTAALADCTNRIAPGVYGSPLCFVHLMMPELEDLLVRRSFGWREGRQYPFQRRPGDQAVRRDVRRADQGPDTRPDSDTGEGMKTYVHTG
jgi:hypothetical protein